MIDGVKMYSFLFQNYYIIFKISSNIEILTIQNTYVLVTISKSRKINSFVMYLCMLSFVNNCVLQ